MKKILFIVLILVALTTTGCFLKPDVNQAYLSNILIDGKPITNFDPQTFEYVTVLENGYEGIPEIVAVPQEPNHIINLFYPEKLPGTILISVVPDVQPGVTVVETIYRITVLFAGG